MGSHLFLQLILFCDQYEEDTFGYHGTPYINNNSTAKGRKIMRKNISKMVGLCLTVCSASFFVGCPLDSDAKAIHKAAHGGDLKRVREIIEKDPSQINVQDVGGFTPLQLASGKGHIGVVEYLLEHGADTELGNNVGYRPLSLAAKFGHYETVRVLLERGARVNSTDVFGNTALHAAAMYSGREIMELLVSHGADVNARDKYQDTPLHQAAKLNNIEAAKALVEHGADILAKNYYDYSKPRGAWEVRPSRNNMNKTPKEIAVKAGYEELVLYLQTKEDEREKKEEEGKENAKE